MIAIDDSTLNGLNVHEWINKLESTSSRNAKEAIIAEALHLANSNDSGAQAFLNNCYAAYSPYLVYGVKQIPVTTGLVDRANPWVDFWSLCDDLHSRRVTGNLAKDLISSLSLRFDSDNWSVCRGVLTKDLRVGISEKTLNKILAGTSWEIPVFSCQLASDSNDHQKKMQGLKQLQVKLDGVRVLAVVTANSVDMMSRNGKAFDNFEHIADELRAAYTDLAALFGDEFVLDGEVIGSSFQELMKQARRKVDVDSADTVYNVFDIVDLDSFQAGVCGVSQQERTSRLAAAESIIDGMSSVSIVDHIVVNLDTEVGIEQMQEFAATAIANGFEGIMIKDLDADYKCKRSTAWLKSKPTVSVDLTVVGFEEGTGKNLGRLGAIICEGEDNGRAIRVNVGSGLTDDNRTEFWAERDSLLGRLVEVQADVVTQNRDGTYSLRFPRFLRFRSFSDGVKI